jgi:excisionase family DNA binding protein
MVVRKISENLISLATLAKRLDRSERTIYRWRKRMNLPHYRVGRSVLFDPVEVMGLLRIERECYGSEGCIKACEKCERHRTRQGWRGLPS